MRLDIRYRISDIRNRISLRTTGSAAFGNGNSPGRLGPIAVCENSLAHAIEHSRKFLDSAKKCIDRISRSEAQPLHDDEMGLKLSQ